MRLFLTMLNSPLHLNATQPDPLAAPRFHYVPGHPRQVRFDARAGHFNIGGTQVLGHTLTFLPLAWRVFDDDILQLGRRLWAELFFADHNHFVSAVLFHGYSAQNLLRLHAHLFYHDLRLTDGLLTAEAIPRVNRRTGSTYYVADFRYQLAPPDEVRAHQAFTAATCLYREDTITGQAHTRLQHGYRLPC